MGKGRSSGRSILQQSHAEAFIGAFVLATAACTGQIGERSGTWAGGPGITTTSSTGSGPGSTGTTGSGTGSTGTGGDGGTGGPEVLPPFAPAAPAFARLTAAQYANVIHDLLGSQIQVPELEPDTRPYLFSVIGASTTTISEHGVDLYAQAAHTIATAAFTDTARRAKLVPCTVATPLDATCLARFITEFGLRAWRRPLEATEVDRYKALGTQIGLADAWKAIEYVTAALLQSAHFLYRVELGEADPDHPGWMRYTGYEMATRLSFLLRNGFPDTELFAAAARGDLVTKDGILQQVNRLVGDVAPTETMIQNLYAEYLDLPLLADVVFPATMDPKGTMAASMQSEVAEVVTRIALRQPADMRTLFTTRTVAVNSDLAPLYGLAPTTSTALQPAELPADAPRAGILTTGALLTLNNRPNRTSPTIRGFFVRERLLCGSVPPPPAGIPPIREDDMGPPKTIREKLELHRTNPTCAACHRMMDPLGLGMENFDQYGRHRTTYETGQVVDDEGDLDGIKFHGAKELGDLLSKDPRTMNCLTKQIFRYASSRLEAEGELIVLDKLGKAFVASGYLLKPMLLELVTSDGFRYLKPEAP